MLVLQQERTEAFTAFELKQKGKKQKRRDGSQVDLSVAALITIASSACMILNSFVFFFLRIYVSARRTKNLGKKREKVVDKVEMRRLMLLLLTAPRCTTLFAPPHRHHMKHEKEKKLYSPYI